MAKFNTALLAFNRGLVASLALARIDLKRLALSAAVMINWMPRTLGSMMLRPGLRYITTSYNSAKAKYIPFVFSVSDTAIIELTDSVMRVLVNEVPITRVAVSSALTNGTFNTNLTGWTDADEAGGTSVWATGGYASLTGNGTNAAILTQTMTVSGADQNKEHAFNITIAQGSILLRVGSTAGGDEYISETTLLAGVHSLAFTPTGANVYVQLMNRNKYAGLVDSIVVASSGVMTLATNWTLSDLDNVRFDQSGDVIFVAATGLQQRRIERRATNSWSVTYYRPNDGPFRAANVTPIRLTVSAITGNITITASKPFFKSTNVGSLFRITSTGQQVAAAITGADQWSDPIRVTGIGTGRIFAVIITGTWSGTVRVQRSVEAPGAWTNVNSYTANTSTTINDSLDNQIIYYRIGIAVSEYTSGTANVQLTFSAGSISGIARVTEYTSSTQVSAEVLQDMGGTASTDDWEEGDWSSRRGFPSSVSLHDGRLWWAGKDKIWGSVSDAFTSFDSLTEGDSGPISRSIGQGPVDTINWLLSAQRLIIGGQGAEFTAQSSSIDEPLTPSNFNLRPVSTQGSKNVSAVRLDNSAVFVQRGGARVYEMQQQDQFSGFSTMDMTTVVPGIGKPGISRIAVQRQPDTRIHCVRSDGTVAILVYDSAEDVKCWVEFETDGDVEDVVVIPGATDSPEDKVYYSVKRTINGSTVRYLERWADEDDCVGGTQNKQADSFIIYNGSATTNITGLSHLEGEEVIIWADGADVGTKTVSSGAITLDVAASQVIVGLGYQAQFQSSKLAYTADFGTPLNQVKRVDHIGVIMMNTHYKGLRYGRDLDENSLDELPDMKGWEAVAEDTVFEMYDEPSFEFSGSWDTDSRVCLVADAPRPCTVLAVTISMAQHEKI